MRGEGKDGAPDESLKEIAAPITRASRSEWNCSFERAICGSVGPSWVRDGKRVEVIQKRAVSHTSTHKILSYLSPSTGVIRLTRRSDRPTPQKGDRPHLFVCNRRPNKRRPLPNHLEAKHRPGHYTRPARLPTIYGSLSSLRSRRASRPARSLRLERSTSECFCRGLCSMSAADSLTASSTPRRC